MLIIEATLAANSGSMPGTELKSSRHSKVEGDLALEYWRRAEAYMAKLGGATPPSFIVQLPEGQLDVIVEQNLDDQLLSIFVLHGWSGIIEVEKAYATLAYYPYPSDTGEKLRAAEEFFRFTRNRLALLVYASLGRIESTARHRMFGELRAAALMLNTARSRLDVRRREQSLAGKLTDDAEGFMIGNTVLLVEIHRQLADRATMIEVLQNNAKAHRLLLERQNQLFEDLSGGVAMPSERQNALLRDPAARQATAVVDATDRAVEQILADLGEFLQQCHARFGVEVGSFLQLLLPQIKPHAAIDDVEKIIVETLWMLLERIDKLVVDLNKSESALERLLPLSAPGVSAAAKREPFSGGSDVGALFVAAAEKVTGERGDVLALLSEPLLLSLLQDDTIPFGSFDHTVAVHYVAHLMPALEALRESRAAWVAAVQAVDAIFSLAAGLVSLMTGARVTPVGIAILSGTKWLSRIVIAVALDNIVLQLKQIDEAINTRLVQMGHDSDTVGQLGDLLAIRSEYLTDLKIDAAITFAATIGSRQPRRESRSLPTIARNTLFRQKLPPRWAVVKSWLLVRGYLADLETLLGTSP